MGDQRQDDRPPGIAVIIRPMENPAPSQTANRRIARAAATAMAPFIISSLVGLASGVVIDHDVGAEARRQ